MRKLGKECMNKRQVTEYHKWSVFLEKWHMERREAWKVELLKMKQHERKVLSGARVSKMSKREVCTKAILSWVCLCWWATHESKRSTTFEIIESEGSVVRNKVTQEEVGQYAIVKDFLIINLHGNLRKIAVDVIKGRGAVNHYTVGKKRVEEDRGWRDVENRS